MNTAFSKIPPLNWNRSITVAGQSREYAEAMAKLGYRHFYYVNGEARALIQIRGVTYPFVRRLLSRAYIYPNLKTASDLENLLTLLKLHKIPFVKVGNNFWGIRDRELLSVSNCKLVKRYTFVVDLSQTEETLWKKFHKRVRQAIRKSEKEGVTVKEIKERRFLEDFYRPYHLTAKRIHSFQPYTSFPLSVFETFFQESMTSGFARFFVALWQEQVIASRMVICFRDSMLAYQSGILREFAKKEGSTAIHWHCIKLAREQGFKVYDMGGCTPGLCESDSRYGIYSFKKKFSGKLVSFYNGEITLDKRLRQFQDKYLADLWDRFHPYYCKIISAIRNT